MITLNVAAPVVGVRTSTHSFNGQKGKWAKLNFNYNGEDYRGGLGEQIFGNYLETSNVDKATMVQITQWVALLLLFLQPQVTQ